MRRRLFSILAVILLLTGCSIRQGQLVVIQDQKHEETSAKSLAYDYLGASTQDFPVEKYAEAIAKTGTPLLPIAVSPDFSKVFAYEPVINGQLDEANSRTISGNMLQEMDLYVIGVENREAVNLGRFVTIKDFRFDESGNYLAFIDGSSTIYMYNLHSGQLQKLISDPKPNAYKTLSWSKDSKRLIINTRMEFDLLSKQFISIALDSYTPCIMRKYNSNSYIVQMKNNEYNDMIAFYDFDDRSYTSIAGGTYIDSDNTNVIYTKDEMYGLNIVNLSTLESKTIENGPVYAAYVMKSTGEILYSTLNPDLESAFRYQLVKLNPADLSKASIKLNSPTFYVSPAEDRLYFISNYGENKTEVDITGFRQKMTELRSDPQDLYKIKATILKMYQLDYKYSGTYEKYEERCKELYANTPLPVPQEALENKLVDFKRFNMPLPIVHMENHIPPNIRLDKIVISENIASVNLGFFYLNAMELVKVNDNWYITGFSTHPDSQQVKDIFSVVREHLNAIRGRRYDDALNHWYTKEDTDFLLNQRKIVSELLNNAEKYRFEIGEIELWSSSLNHRAETPETADAAKVKIIIKEGAKTTKYKLLLTRDYETGYKILSWNTDPLSISQLF